jgi:DMSO/TMAO reductase YedYZ heme-binding membrane subunit
MAIRSRRLLRIERGLATVSGFLFVVTLLWREWIEILFGVDPDKGSGALEWAITLAFLAMTIAFTALAHHEQRRRLA